MLPATQQPAHGVVGYWKRAARLALKETDFFTSKKAVSALGLIILRELLTTGAGFSTLTAAGTTVGIAVCAYLVLTAFEYAVRFARAPVRLDLERVQEGERIAADAMAAREDLKALREARPDALVTMVEDGHATYLEVSNLGKEGAFEAEVRLLEAVAQNYVRCGAWPGYWERAKGPRSQIAQGMRDRLCIGTHKYEPLGLRSLELHLCFFDASAGGMASEMGEKLIDQVQPGPDPVFMLEVTITSTPAPRNGPFRQTYQLSLSGLREVSR